MIEKVMRKKCKLQLLRLLLRRPVSLGFNRFPPSDAGSEEKCCAPVYLSCLFSSAQFQWSVFHSPVQNRSRSVGLPAAFCITLLVTFHGRWAAFPLVSFWEGNEPAEVTGYRERGSPVSEFPETKRGVAGERQKELHFYFSSSLSPSPEANTLKCTTFLNTSSLELNSNG